MRRRVTVLGYSFRLILLAVCMVVLTFIGVMSGAFQRSIQDWNTLRNQNLQTTVGASIAQNYRVEGSLTPELLQDVLRPVLSPTMYVVVADSERNPLYAFIRGERVPIEPNSSLESILESVPGTVALPNVLLDANDVLGYVAAGTLGFTSDPVNRRFLRSMGVSMGAGIGLSVLIGLVAAMAFSRALSRHTQRVNGLLARIAAGERDIPISSERVIEFEMILQSVQQLQQQLKREEELRRHWARDVAHDLRTPITALKTQFDAMRESVISPTPRRIASLYSEVERIERLVTDLRALNTMEESLAEPQMCAIQAHTFLQQVVQPFGVDLEQGRIHISCHVQSICGDEHLLLRAVTNVVQNALQHGKADTPVEIRIFPYSARSRQDDRSWVRLSVVNHGEVSQADAPFVFERLYRGETSRTTDGSGLGLSIAKAIVEQHGGSIGLRSADDMTEIWMLLPDGG